MYARRRQTLGGRRKSENFLFCGTCLGLKTERKVFFGEEMVRLRPPQSQGFDKGFVYPYVRKGTRLIVPMGGVAILGELRGEIIVPPEGCLPTISLMVGFLYHQFVFEWATLENGWYQLPDLRRRLKRKSSKFVKVKTEVA